MTAELVVHAPQATGLSIQPEQTGFNDQQIATLRHMGVEDASPADLAVFFHVAKRTGLDPFARQIYMISRKSRGEVKQTIQTGIDGYRLIGRRAADRTHEAISVSAPEWAHPDGGWRPVWSSAWGMPVAARVTITRGGAPFTAVALFDEYKQTKFDGGLTAMWAQRPAGQIAKCAEALAWRMAFPQDLAGVYVEDELQHAESERPAPVGGSGADRLRARLNTTTDAPPTEPVEDAQPVDAEIVGEPIPDAYRTEAQSRALWAALNKAGLGDRDDALAFLTETLEREVDSTKHLTQIEASRAIDALKAITA